MLKWAGVEKIFLGSSGHDGRDALEKVVGHLKKGYNTLVACDGPAGPYKEVKAGVLEMSLNTQIPIIPITFRLTRFFTLSGWDKKRVPYPFSTIYVDYRPKVVVTKANYEDSRKAIAQGMG